jgi:deoxyribose-phosphate aldolase
VDPDHVLLIACLDLTSLADDEDDAAIETLCARAVRPVPSDRDLRVAAVCLWPRWVPVARRFLRGSAVRIACATGGFPVPDSTLGERLHQIEEAVAAGADEVDVPINRFLLDEPDALRGELAATRTAAGNATWKAIRTLATAAIAEGADLVKSSTGKGVPGVTPEAAAILAATVRDADRTVGLKLSGGIRGVGQAANHLAQVRAILGPDWAAPSRFRIGASALLDALVA